MYPKPNGAATLNPPYTHLLPPTPQNFTLCVAYFAGSGILTCTALVGRPTPPWAWRVVRLLLMIELPSALLVDIVTWTLLLPAVTREGHPEMLVNPFSFHMHAFNVRLPSTPTVFECAPSHATVRGGIMPHSPCPLLKPSLPFPRPHPCLSRLNLSLHLPKHPCAGRDAAP